VVNIKAIELLRNFVVEFLGSDMANTDQAHPALGLATRAK